MQTNTNHKFKVRQYDDGRMEISAHPFELNQPKKRIDYTSEKRERTSYMTTKCYVRNIKSAHRKLFAKNYPEDKCYFSVTLTIQNNLDIGKLQNQFRRFLGQIKYYYDNVEYLKVIELTESHRFHIHVIFQFDTAPMLFTQDTIEKLWKLGNCDIRSVYDIYGQIEYLTKFKECQVQKRSDRDIGRYTYFPVGVKLVTTSKNFGVICDETQYKDFYLPKEEVDKLIDEERKKGRFVRTESHRYISKKGIPNMFTCLNRMYVKPDLSLKSLINNLDLNNDGNCKKPK